MKVLQKLHAAFGHIVFYEKGHRYYDTVLGMYITSVTQRIKKYTKPFDTKYWTTYKALERAGYVVRKYDETGMYVNGELVDLSIAWNLALDQVVTPQQIEQEWESISTQGKKKGTNLHNYAEKSIYGKKEQGLFPAVDKWVRKDYIEGKFFPIRMEIIVGNEFVCGQADNLSGYGQDIILRDYKTDKKIAYNNPWQDLLGELSHLEDCEFNKYSLQLSTYRLVIEEVAKINITASQIIWFPKDEDRYEVIDLPYLKDEARFLCTSKITA